MNGSAIVGHVILSHVSLGPYCQARSCKNPWDLRQAAAPPTQPTAHTRLLKDHRGPVTSRRPTLHSCSTPLLTLGQDQWTPNFGQRLPPSQSRELSVPAWTSMMALGPNWASITELSYMTPSVMQSGDTILPGSIWKITPTNLSTANTWTNWLTGFHLFAYQHRILDVPQNYEQLGHHEEPERGPLPGGQRNEDKVNGNWPRPEDEHQDLLQTKAGDILQGTKM